MITTMTIASTSPPKYDCEILNDIDKLNRKNKVKKMKPNKSV